MARKTTEEYLCKKKIMKEVWKAVTGYEGLYEVSNLGRIRSLDREVERIDRWSQQITLIKRQGCIMDPYTTLKGGYLRIGLSKNGDQKNHKENPLNL